MPTKNRPENDKLGIKHRFRGKNVQMGKRSGRELSGGGSHYLKIPRAENEQAQNRAGDGITACKGGAGNQPL